MASQDPAKTDLVTRKFARDFEDMSCLHHSSLGFFETYFADLAEAERERYVVDLHCKSPPGLLCAV